MEKKEIKELVELLAAVEVLAVAVKKVLKDGQVDLSDAAVMVELGAQFPVLMAAIEGLDKLPEEVKDIDADEALALVGKLYAMAKKVQEI